MSESVTSSHRTRKILWNGTHPANKISSTERCGKPPPSVQMWYPQAQREGSDGVGCRIQIETHMVRGQTMNKKGSFRAFLGCESSPLACSWILSLFYASLKDSQDFQKLHVFPHGCLFLTFSTNHMWLIQTVYLQWTDPTIPLLWVNA